MTTGQSPKTPSELEKLIQEVDAEARRWRIEGLSPDMVTYDLFAMSMKVDMIYQIFKELGLIDPDELELRFKREQLSRMQLLREQATEQKKAAVKKPRIIGPGGEILN